jgi:hypothetical protein
MQEIDENATLCSRLAPAPDVIDFNEMSMVKMVQVLSIYGESTPFSGGCHLVPGDFFVWRRLAL